MFETRKIDHQLQMALQDITTLQIEINNKVHKLDQQK